jgi:hypothetical protein
MPSRGVRQNLSTSMQKPYIIGLTRVWNQSRIITEILDHAFALTDWLVILINQPTDEITRRKILEWCQGRANVSVIDYQSAGLLTIHESAERMALYYFGRAVAESVAKESGAPVTWFYTFDSDEILDCTRDELDYALMNASTPCLTVRLVDFWTRPDAGEGYDYEKIFDARQYSETSCRMRPYFYRHNPDPLLAWKLVADRFHSCTMVMKDWGDHNNQDITSDSWLWVRHYGQCIDEEHEKQKLERYRSFKSQWSEASPWAEKLPSGNDFIQPETALFEDLKSGKLPLIARPLAGR